MFPINIFRILRNKHVFIVLALIFVNKRQPPFPALGALFKPQGHKGGTNTPNQKLACFVLLISKLSAPLFFKEKMCASYSNCPRNSIGLLIKTIFFFTILNHNLKTAWPTKNFNAIFEFLGKFALRCIYYFSKTC